jgi:hypothetical protein
MQILHLQSLTQIKNVFAYSKHSNLEWIIHVFFKRLSSLPNVHHFFFKLKKILTLMIRRAKGFELMKIVFITHLNTFGSKVFLTFKIMDFKNVILTKLFIFI